MRKFFRVKKRRLALGHKPTSLLNNTEAVTTALHLYKFYRQFCSGGPAVFWSSSMHSLSVRRFFCGNCNQEVYICSHCDRGNIYCGKRCSKFQRLKNHRESNRQSRKHPLCKLKAAQRQQRYREKLKKQELRNSAIKSKVTDQGTAIISHRSIITSKSSSQKSKLDSESRARAAQTSQHPISRLKALLSKEAITYYCSFCKCRSSQTVRYESLVYWKRGFVAG